MSDCPRKVWVVTFTPWKIGGGGGLSSHVRDRVVLRTTLPFALGRTTQPFTCAMTTQPFAWDRTTQPFTCRDRRIIIQTYSPSISRFWRNYSVYAELLPKHFPPSFEGIIYSYQRVKYLDLSERLDINCDFTVEPNHAICSNLAIEI